ncbi:MAG TPA: NAD(P)/FAD-dependent oxidoreductase [Thermoanaerobaculia bacterium]
MAIPLRAAALEEVTLDVDVAIIGAGPAGSTLAALLAGRGTSVALIDRDVFPRDKLCGEFLSWDALPVMEPLGVLAAIDAAGSARIRRCRVIGSKRIQEIEFPHEARGVSRVLLDHLLLQTATKAGATRLDGWTAGSLLNDGVEITRDGEVREVRAKVIVGAWGRWGRFDQQLGRAFVRERTRRHFGFKRHYISATSSRDSASIELYSFRDGYLGVNDVEGGITNICGLVHVSRLAGHKGRWDAFIDTLRQEEPRLEALYGEHLPVQADFLSSDPVIFRARSAVERGVFMIGDAAGIIDPLTGNGMAMAIQSALLAAPKILGVLKNPVRRAAIEERYRESHRRFFARRIAWSRAIAAVMSRPWLLDTALGGLGRTSAGAALLRRTRASRDEVARLAESWFC